MTLTSKTLFENFRYLCLAEMSQCSPAKMTVALSIMQLQFIREMFSGAISTCSGERYIAMISKDQPALMMLMGSPISQGQNKVVVGEPCGHESVPQ